MAKKIKMLRPGKFKDVKGIEVTLTAVDLAASAAAYDPAVYACPLVIGHPTLESPSYGKIGAADFSEGFLNGAPAQVAPEFAKVVNGGYFDHVSLSLFSPTAPSNPVPGVWYPRHLGFLGAAAPAVPGLGTVSLAAEEEGIISLSVSFGDWNDRLIARMFRNVKNYLIEVIGQEKADKVLDEWDLQSITEEAVRPEPPIMEYEPAFAEQGGEKSMLTPEQIAAIEAENKNLKAALKATTTSAARAANVAFAEGLVKEGKLLPANQAKVVAVLDFASALDGGNTIEFGEGDGKKTVAVIDTLKEVLASNPKIIEFGELGGGELSTDLGKAIPADLARHV